MDYDVAIVGASAGGCTAATLLGRRGLRVALIERSPDPAAYKTVCTHYIQASATPTIRRLGLAEPIEAAGAIRNSIDLWTRYGWIRDSDDGDLPYGYSIRREKLDPVVRELAASTDGVDMLAGKRATALVERGGRVAGVRVAARDGGETAINARLVVAADGRSSRMAELAGAPARNLPNRRFTYWAYFRDLPLPTPDRAQLWLLDPHVAYAFPNDDGVTLIAYWGLQSELDTFREDVDAAVRAHFAELPNGPRLETGTPISKWLGKVDMPNVYRGCVHRGMALVGDAAQASDPIWGVGLGWAFQSGEWLAEAVGPALASSKARADDLDAALSAYRRRHRRELAAHHLLISDYSRGRRFRAIEKLIFAAGARDGEVAKHMHRYAGRTIGVHQFLAPAMLARASYAVARRAPLVDQPQHLPSAGEAPARPGALPASRNGKHDGLAGERDARDRVPRA